MTENAIQPVVTEGKRGPGRPTKYDPSFDEIIVGFGRQGFSKAEMANAFDVVRETLDDWAKANPSFSDALTRAQQCSLAWWENEARNGINKGSAFNAALWAKSMSGRFPREDYRDRQAVELTGANGGPIKTESKVSLDGLTDAQKAALASVAVEGE